MKAAGGELIAEESYVLRFIYHIEALLTKGIPLYPNIRTMPSYASLF